MRHNFSRVLILVSLFCGVFSLANHIAYAQATEGIEIKPAIIEDNVNPGDVYRFTVTFTNIAQNEKSFYLSSQDITGLDEKGSPQFAPEGQATPYELSSWTNLPPGAITLKAGEARTIPLSIQVPDIASPGAHFGGVFLNTRPGKLETTGAGVGLKVGTIISLRIAGDIVDEAQLREFSTENLIYSTPHVNFSARIENRGNVLVRPHGLIEITDMFGKKMGDIRVNDSAAPVFPGSERSYPSTWDYDGFAFGRYQATVGFAYGEDERKTLSGTTSFWILPLKLIGTVLGIVLVAVLMLYALIRRYINKKLRGMSVSNSKAADVNLYAERYHRSGSRLIVLVLTAFLFSVIFLVVVFLMFA